MMPASLKNAIGAITYLAKNTAWLLG